MDDSTPYRIPDDGRKYLLHVSGGRTSGYMLRCILDAHDGALPNHVRAVFTNTGKEREETLDFLHEIERRWNVPLEWVEYTYRAGRRGGRGAEEQKNWFQRVNHVTARRCGEPFAELIRSRRMVPNVVMRMCTTELKVNTAARYARHVLGWTRPVSILGIRHDEPRRWQKALFTECRTVYPLVDARVSNRDVMDYWGASPFDLDLRASQGNCDLCFLKGQRKLLQLIAEEPARADWWIAQEQFREDANRVTQRKDIRQFLKRASYAELRSRALSWLPFDGPTDDQPVSCFCGD